MYSTEKCLLTFEFGEFKFLMSLSKIFCYDHIDDFCFELQCSDRFYVLNLDVYSFTLREVADLLSVISESVTCSDPTSSYFLF